MKRYIPIFFIIILMLIAYLSGILDYLSFDLLKEKRKLLQELIGSYPFTSSITFILLYTLSTALSLPIGVWLTISAGFLFGQPQSTLYVATGATLGATTLFFAAKTAFGDLLEKKAAPFLVKIEKGLQENAASYLLFLRLIPLFPFWLVNLAPAFLGIPYRTYLWTTAIGILPGTFAFAQAGAGLGSIFDQELEFSFNNILTIEVKIALVSLGVLSLLPILYKKWKTRKEH